MNQVQKAEKDVEILTEGISNDSNQKNEIETEQNQNSKP